VSLSSDPVARLIATDTLNFLTNEILNMVELSVLALSVTAHTPLPDHRVTHLACRLPIAMKIHPGRGGGTSKWALRQMLTRYVPPEWINLPKAGFLMPIGQWLRCPLQEWAEDLFEPGLMQRQGDLQPEPIQTFWRQHLSRRFDHIASLWTVLMWQAWLVQWA